jgi:hypothetical protein
VHSSKTTSSPSGSRSGVNGNTSIRSMTIQSLYSNWLGLYPAAELHLSLRIATPGWQAAGPQLAADPGATLLRSLQHQHRAARSDRTARSRAQPKRALTAGSTARSAEGRRRALTFLTGCPRRRAARRRWRGGDDLPGGSSHRRPTNRAMQEWETKAGNKKTSQAPASAVLRPGMLSTI